MYKKKPVSYLGWLDFVGELDSVGGGDFVGDGTPVVSTGGVLVFGGFVFSAFPVIGFFLTVDVSTIVVVVVSLDRRVYPT
ncbi:MAG: hypothetical protein J7J44_09125 [Deltaproteobacteria bacterium]|nr:hypothetical protein [Deltaproteobacteria bacterium]